MEKYFVELREKIAQAYGIAAKARAEGNDPDLNVESLPAGDLATRVEGLVGPKGISTKIKEFGRENLTKILDHLLGDMSEIPNPVKEKRIEQALRTGLAIITEGVVAAPIEGISKVKINSNPDGSEYLSIYFAGPIRSAGGTAQGLAVLIGDYLRTKTGLQGYRPTGDEIERYVEEIRVYNDRVTRLQYLPTEKDIMFIVKNLPVCVDGDPTEKREVSVHRDLKRVETNRIRGGMCLVIAEGIAQKSTKLMKHASSMGLDWDWLSGVEKSKKVDSNRDIKPLDLFMSETVGGRPVFAAPSAKGAFRLRYGRSRATGIAAKAIHPATMILLDEFIATGTQVKVERPGKGCVITNCNEIDGPIVRLKDGSVVRVESEEYARKISREVIEILFLGDILISYGDFLQTNTPLLPAGYCEEWWRLEAIKMSDRIPLMPPSAEEAVQLAKKFSIPLHPRYTYFWEDIDKEALKLLIGWLSSGGIRNGRLIVENKPEAKRILELLGVPHEVDKNLIVIEEYLPLLYPTGAYDGVRFTLDEFNQRIDESTEKTALGFIQTVSPIKIRARAGTYIGARMGRPEKARERKMQPAVHSLFPIGDYGGRERDIRVAAENNTIRVDIANYECSNCRINTIFSKCPRCGKNTSLKGVEVKDINIAKLWSNATKKVGRVLNVKGVKGMISKDKIPEPLEKGILRAKNEVFVFKDGSIRFDATDAPLTHFKPAEVGMSIKKLRELGYEKDYLGEELKNPEQIVELKVQDVIIPKKAGDYLLRVSLFIDDLLERFYGMPRFYNATLPEDLLGHLVVGLAPHTSAGIVGRIIGFNNAAVCYAHPFWHAAKRRNCDGDEDSLMLILDTLINFSKKYLPEERGGKMDAPLVITTIMNPKEVDDEAHKMEIIKDYPLEFYEKTWQRINPSDVGIKTVDNVIDTNPFSGLNFTHSTRDITGPVVKSRYLRLGKMKEKVNAQLRVAEKIRAIDERVVAELVINSHFLRDIYGNLRKFTRQKFRCVKCNASYRRVPLSGRCTRCGDRLLLTVSEGSIRKYLEISADLCKRYKCSPYMNQRLMLLKRDIDSLFTNDLSKQVGLSEFM